MLSELKTMSDNSINEFPWYAIYTRHQHEKMVAQNLTSKGFETFLPLYATTHNWKDRTKVLSLPLFPCYVFLKGGIERRLQIITTPGIHGLVSCGDQPATIPLIEMEAIRRVVESGARVETHPFLKCGDWVRINRGPLEGIQGILVRKKNISRLVLSVEMLGKSAAIEIDGFQVEPLNATRPRDRKTERGAVLRHTRISEVILTGLKA
jgi:transcription antitermination factor NusG